MEFYSLAQAILPSYGIQPNDYTCEPFGSGLINTTLLVKDRQGAPVHILQRVNDAVFRRPEDIAANLRVLGSHLSRHHPNYLLPLPIPTLDGQDYERSNNNWWRVIPYVPGSHAIDICTRPEEAYEAAFRFGEFTACFEEMNVSKLRDTIPSFHDLNFRWHQFQEALQTGDATRISSCPREIRSLHEQAGIVDTYRRILSDPQVRRRVTHHDTKISNVLFDASLKGLCVIDLDTVMAGYLVSDLGDMFRTYLSPVHEESADLGAIYVRSDFKQAILDGYQEKMADYLTEVEHRLLDYSGAFMIYMQALRFLTDHLNNDVYYGAAYPGQNLVRTRNQLTLLQEYQQSLH